MRHNFKSDTREYVLTKGGKAIDDLQLNKDLMQPLPDWVLQLAKKHNKSPGLVAEQLIRYRNSFAYQKALLGIK